MATSRTPHRTGAHSGKSLQFSPDGAAKVFELRTAVQDPSFEHTLVNEADRGEVIQGCEHVAHLHLVIEFQITRCRPYWITAVDAEYANGLGRSEPGVAIGSAKGTVRRCRGGGMHPVRSVRAPE